jgi:hypothetical protein
VTIRNVRPLAVALGLSVPGAVGAAAPATPMAVPAAGNQTLADAVAARLTTSPATQGADVSVHCQGGVVTVTGFCRDAAQKAKVLEQIAVVPGVKQVRDGVQVAPAGMMQAQATEMAQLPSGPVVTPAPVGVMPGMAMGGPVIEPVPLGASGAVMAPNQAPPLPPYAWPTYAPHNNVSRVAYPQTYPANAFPFIGPYYPFPKVPLGWRSVRLDWEDGHWWIGKTSTPNDYWRTRFW